MDLFIKYCENGDIDNIKKMLCPQQDLFSQEKQICLEGCDLNLGFLRAFGKYDIIRYLCELYRNDSKYRPININNNREVSFRSACIYGHYDTVKYLVELHYKDRNYKPINIHDWNEEGFTEACINGHYMIVKYLVELHNNKPCHLKKLELDATIWNLNWSPNFERIYEIEDGHHYYNYSPINIYAKREKGFVEACKNGHYMIANYLLKITKRYKRDVYCEQFKNYLMIFKKIDKFLL